MNGQRERRRLGDIEHLIDSVAARFISREDIELLDALERRIERIANRLERLDAETAKKK